MESETMNEQIIAELRDELKIKDSQIMATLKLLSDGAIQQLFVRSLFHSPLSFTIIKDKNNIFNQKK